MLPLFARKLALTVSDQPYQLLTPAYPSYSTTPYPTNGPAGSNKAHTAELLPGGDYKLVVKSRAGDAGGPLQTSFRKVKYLRVVDPEPPTPTGPTVTAINDGTFHAGGGNVVTGANMRFADEFPGNHLVIKDSEGTDMEAMISDDDSTPVTETSFALNIDAGNPLTDGEEYTFEFAMVDSAGQPVTVTHTARWQSE